jgi:hypothetical protein
VAARSKKARGKTARKVTVPKGYERISGFGESWPGQDPEIGATLEGTITEFGDFETGKGKDKRTVQTAKIETKDGKIYTVYESARLRALFEYEEGTQVFLVYNGLGDAKRGQSAPKLFDVFVK